MGERKKNGNMNNISFDENFAKAQEDESLFILNESEMSSSFEITEEDEEIEEQSRKWKNEKQIRKQISSMKDDKAIEMLQSMLKKKLLHKQEEDKFESNSKIGRVSPQQRASSVNENEEQGGGVN